MGQCFQSIDLSWPGLLATFLVSLCLLLNAIALGSTDWAVAEPKADVQLTQYPDVKMGVTSYCKGTRCLRYTDNSFLDQPNDLALVTKTRAITAMLSICIFTNLIALVHVGFAVGRKGKSPLIRFVSFELFFAAFLGAVSMFIWVSIMDGLGDITTGAIDELNFSTSSSFGCQVSAWVLNLLAGFLFVSESRSIVYTTIANVNQGGAGML
jgi:hypothetical protein